MFAGSAYVHGPLNSDHWYTYVADDCKRPTSAAADRTLNLMMYDLEPEVAENFYKSEKVMLIELGWLVRSFVHSFIVSGMPLVDPTQTCLIAVGIFDTDEWRRHRETNP